MTNGEIIEQLENTIGLIKQDGKDWLDDRDIPILEVCIKALTALDKIITEIEEIATYDGIYIDRAYVLEIIDKYRNDVWDSYDKTMLLK